MIFCLPGTSPENQFKLQDWALHSFPFSYTAVDIASSDGADHAIQLYFDITLRECSTSHPHTHAHSSSTLEFNIDLSTSDTTNVVTWNTSFTDKSVYHMGQRQTIQTLTERNDMAEDGHQVVAYSAVIIASTWGNYSLITSNEILRRLMSP